MASGRTCSPAPNTCRPFAPPPTRWPQCALAASAHLQDIYFLWRPFLRDPDDDMVFELAVAAGCRYVVTHNPRDFVGSDLLGVQAILPGEFPRLLSSTPT